MGSGKGARKRMAKTLQLTDNVRTMHHGKCVTLIHDKDDKTKTFKMDGASGFVFKGDMINDGSKWFINECLFTYKDPKHGGKQNFYPNPINVINVAKEALQNPDKELQDIPVMSSVAGELQWDHDVNISKLYFRSASGRGYIEFKELAVMSKDDFMDIQTSILALAEEIKSKSINQDLLKEVISKDVNF